MARPVRVEARTLNIVRLLPWAWRRFVQGSTGEVSCSWRLASDPDEIRPPKCDIVHRDGVKEAE